MTQQGLRLRDEFEALYDWLRNKVGITSRAMALLQASPSSFEILTFHFGNKPTHIDDRILLKGNQLAPHVSKALLINRPFQLLQERFDAVLEVLDRFKLGVFILDSQRRIILNNYSAKIMLENEDGFSVDPKGRIRLFVEDRQGQLERYLGENDVESIGETCTLVLMRKFNKSPYYIQVSRLSPLMIGGVDEKYVMIVVDPERTDIVDISGIKQVFNLSESEGDVSRYLVAGHSNEEIADIRNVALETVKAQLKSIFRKLGCHSRTEVIRLAHRINIPIDKPAQSQRKEKP